MFLELKTLSYSTDCEYRKDTHLSLLITHYSLLMTRVKLNITLRYGPGNRQRQERGGGGGGGGTGRLRRFGKGPDRGGSEGHP